MRYVAAMDSIDDVVITAASDADYEWSAATMSATDPWITLGRDVSRCMASLRRPHAELFLARRGDERLGFICLQEQGVAGSPYVVAIAVAAEARGQGVGTRLLQFAERRWPGVRGLFLCVSDFNVRARALYERYGFRVVGELKDYAARGHSELLMEKSLR